MNTKNVCEIGVDGQYGVVATISDYETFDAFDDFLTETDFENPTFEPERLSYLHRGDVISIYFGVLTPLAEVQALWRQFEESGLRP
jgi:hypothetical protein